MFASLNIKTMNKSDKFEKELQELARFARVISHPARLSILKFLAESKTCISGDISQYLPLSRTTVSQHLKELRDMGLIQGSIDGLKINYCLNATGLERFSFLFNQFFSSIDIEEATCSTQKC